MRFATLAILASAAVVTAQTSTASAGGDDKCDAQNIVDACKATIQTEVDKCKGNDWICLCDNYTNLLTCYNNCPDSAEKSPVQNQVTQFCNAAAPLSASSKASAATAKATKTTDAEATATESEAQETLSGAEGFGSGTASATGAANTDSAAGALAVPAGGALAALFGLAQLL